MRQKVDTVIRHPGRSWEQLINPDIASRTMLVIRFLLGLFHSTHETAQLLSRMAGPIVTAAESLGTLGDFTNVISSVKCSDHRLIRFSFKT